MLVLDPFLYVPTPLYHSFIHSLLHPQLLAAGLFYVSKLNRCKFVCCPILTVLLWLLVQCWVVSTGWRNLKWSGRNCVLFGKEWRESVQMPARWAMAAVTRTKEQTFLISYAQDVLPGWFIKVQPCSYNFMRRVAIFTYGPKHDHSNVVLLTFLLIAVLTQINAQLF